MRTHVLSIRSLLAVSALALSTALPAQAQQYLGSGNNRIGSIGDLPDFLLQPGHKPYGVGGLDFRTLGLFGDSEVFPSFNPENRPAPFIFSFPNFAAAGNDFTGVTYQEYLGFVANSYELNDPNDYLTLFAFQNPNTVAGGFTFQEFDGALDQYNQQLDDRIASYGDLSQLTPDQFFAIQIDFENFRNDLTQSFEESAIRLLHEGDFLAGGGFLQFGDPVIPVVPEPEPEPFVPFEPVFTDPLIPVIPGSDAEAVAAAAEAASQASSSAANVAVVPEPATLGLIALGSGMLLARRKR